MRRCTRTFGLSSLGFAALLMWACSGDGRVSGNPVAPRVVPAALGQARDKDKDPGRDGEGHNGQLVACSRRETQTGIATIGPSGGTLVVGNNLLVVPPGALLAATSISGTVSAGPIAVIHLEPSGLQFKRPAGLVLDATGCALSDDDVPDVVYLDDGGQIIERIEAVFVPSMHRVVAPITHFSGYSIAF